MSRGDVVVSCMVYGSLDIDFQFVRLLKQGRRNEAGSYLRFARGPCANLNSE